MGWKNQVRLPVIATYGPLARKPGARCASDRSAMPDGQSRYFRHCRKPASSQKLMPFTITLFQVVAIARSLTWNARHQNPTLVDGHCPQNRCIATKPNVVR
jgi:hypothetical protein